MASTGETNSDNTSLFHRLDEYSWDSDQEFQGGLRAILGSVEDPAQVQHLTLRAKCYYYARKAGTAVDFDGYKRWVENGGQGVDATNGMGELDVPQQYKSAVEQSEVVASDAPGSQSVQDAPKPATFAEICDMIAEGKPIPGIKDIPNTILDGQASERQAATRKKPWEKNSEAGDKPSWMT